MKLERKTINCFHLLTFQKWKRVLIGLFCVIFTNPIICLSQTPIKTQLDKSGWIINNKTLVLPCTFIHNRVYGYATINHHRTNVLINLYEPYTWVSEKYLRPLSITVPRCLSIDGSPAPILVSIQCGNISRSNCPVIVRDPVYAPVQLGRLFFAGCAVYADEDRQTLTITPIASTTSAPAPPPKTAAQAPIVSHVQGHSFEIPFRLDNGQPYVAAHLDGKRLEMALVPYNGETTFTKSQLNAIDPYYLINPQDKKDLSAQDVFYKVKIRQLSLGQIQKGSFTVTVEDHLDPETGTTRPDPYPRPRLGSDFLQPWTFVLDNAKMVAKFTSPQ